MEPSDTNHIPPAPEAPQEDTPEVRERRDMRALFTGERRIRHLKDIEALLETFRPGERALLYGLSIVLALSTLFLLGKANSAVSTLVPATGGSIVEGEIGVPRFINPLLAISQTDRDITALVYSGLTREAPDGSVIPDLAENYEVSEDGTEYVFRLRADATFHDGEPVTAADVLYTVTMAQAPDVKSPRRADWEGVAVSAPDEHTVIFKLPHAYAPFIENTEIGILPKHLWENITPDAFPFHTLNTKPVGSGPYQVKTVAADKTGTPTRYDLVPFDDFALGTPYLKRITFRFYAEEADLAAALQSGQIESFAGASPERVGGLKVKHARIVATPLTRVFGVFFNQNHAPMLADATVRAAAVAAVDARTLIESVLGGYGTPLDGPIPPGLISGIPAATFGADAASSTAATDRARTILERGGWTYDDEQHQWTKKKTVLSLTISTPDTPELAATARAVADQWRAAGIRAEVQVYPLSEFNTTVLRPRNYDAVLFGEVVGRSLDLFAFWHSSQRNDPGLNLSLYANTKADKLLASARAETNQKAREKLYRSFAALVEDDQPAIFLYAPEFLYVVPDDLQGLSLGALTAPSDRFASAYLWYMETERVWSIFAKTGEMQ